MVRLLKQSRQKTRKSRHFQCQPCPYTIFREDDDDMDRSEREDAEREREVEDELLSMV